MKLNRMITLLVLALLMALCMVLVACGTDPIAVGENPGAHEHDQTPGEDEGTDGDAVTPGSVCLHKNYTLVNKISADCQNEGYTGDKVCSACEKVLETGRATAKGACRYEDVEILLEANCANVGVKRCVCKVCGDERTESVEKLGHQFNYAFNTASESVSYTVEATHTKYCTREGCDYSVEEAHSGTSFVKAPTCEENGYTYIRKCGGCGAECRQYDENKPALGHDWGEWEETTAPTCQTEGVATKTCSRGCTETKSIDIDPDAHTWDEGVVDGDVVNHTCTNEGCEATVQMPVVAPAPEGGSDEE